MGATRDGIRDWRGPAVLTYGFRPFFLLAAIWAALAVPIWVVSFTLGDGTVGGTDGRLWHTHEMLFGYGAGVIAGFLLTAVPNWTGRLPVSGWPLAGLVGLWLVGRAAGFLPASVGPVAPVADVAFLVVFAALIWREILAAKNRRNLPVAVMVSVLACANIAFHASAQWPEAGPHSERVAVAVITALIALIGGRIIPSFTQNWVLPRGLARPAPFGLFDKAALVVTVAGLVLWVVAPHASATGFALLAAGLLSLVRLARWRGWQTWPESMVWVLHLGFVWLPVGFLLLGASALAPAAVPFTAGVHALTAGGIGVMTLAVMTRASRGHTGRPRASDLATTAIYTLILAAAAVRVAAPLLPDLTPALLGVSAALWVLAFGGFAAVYGPMLVRKSL
jgi:uncharacterized protein involved in response to NO